MRKKHLAYTLGFLCAFLSLSGIDEKISTTTNSVNASSEDRNVYYEVNGSTVNIAAVGHGINLVNSTQDKINSSDFKAYSTILKEDYVFNAYDKGYPSGHSETRTYSKADDTFESLVKNVTQNFDTSVTGSATYGPDAVKMSAKFGATNDEKFATSLSQFLYYGKFQYNIGNWGIPIGSKDDLKRNLDQSYVTEVTKLVSGDGDSVSDNAINNFFDFYGTHLLTRGTFGGMYEVYYKCFSNTIDLSQKSTASLQTSLDGKVFYNGANFGVGLTSDYSIAKEMNQSSKKVSSEILCESTGGNIFTAHSFEELKVSIDSWINSIESKPALISTTDAIPLWEIMPTSLDTSEYSNRLKKLFERYKYNKCLESISFAGSNGANKVHEHFAVPGSDSKITEVGYNEEFDSSHIWGYLLGGGIELWITSSNAGDNYWYDYTKKDEADISIDLKNVDHASLGLLKKLGFTTATVTVKMEVEEKRNCTEIVRLYSYKSNVPGEKFSNGNLIAEKVIDIGENDPKQFKSVKFENISIDSLLSYEKIFLCLDVTDVSTESTMGEWTADTITVDVDYSKTDTCNFAPTDWGFAQQYFFTSNARGVNKNTVLEKFGNTYNTERLRCGTILNEKTNEKYVVLSAKRQNAGKAYFEIKSRFPVWRVVYEVAKWRSDDGLNASDCTAIVETCDFFGNWKTDTDLLNGNLSEIGRGYGFKRFGTRTGTPIYGIRFTTTAPATGTKNLARLALKNITFEFDY